MHTFAARGSQMQLKGLILDVDGTLIDSNDAHARAWRDVLKENGYDFKVEEVCRKIGMGGDKLVASLIGESRAKDLGKAAHDRKREIFWSRYADSLKPFPKVRELLLRLSREGYAFSVATSSKREDMKKLLSIAGIEDLIVERTSASDADKTKPDPDIVEAALKKLELAPDEVLMLGDTPYDIEAAARLGIQTLAFRSGGWGTEDLKAALEVYADAEDLLLHLDGSVLIRQRAAA